MSGTSQDWAIHSDVIPSPFKGFSIYFYFLFWMGMGIDVHN